MNGFKTYRHTNNPVEKKLHDKFIEWYVNEHTNLDLFVFPAANAQQTIAEDTLSDREKRIVITMVQWMGTPLGQSLLRECGFEQVQKPEKEKGKVFLKDPKGLNIFKKKYDLQGFVYLDDDDKPTDCSSMVKWLNKLEIKARTENRANELAFEFLNKNYPEYNGFINLF